MIWFFEKLVFVGLLGFFGFQLYRAVRFSEIRSEAQVESRIANPFMFWFCVVLYAAIEAFLISELLGFGLPRWL
ncbi:MAG: hypothetical protein B7Z08_12270 [Sphingomonadales bacterium 32-68-7]|nr:MAG: hypothetical protein B7Z33_13275 [Sphingomonadales bacterium 12-68-11]OYX07512.1 MAG: hypothetical protein B7Z08_12270 [Sphingomonadales bacterium 32-68-7]